MPTKLRKLKPRRLEADTLIVRAMAVGKDGIDVEQRSVPIVLATENPVDTYDFARGIIVRESLDMKGCELPESGQVPMLDTHGMYSVRAQLGSIRDLKVKGKTLIGRAYFSTHPDAVQVFQDIVDGHITDLSVGAQRLESEYQGKDKKVVRRWKLLEGSLVVKGADPNAKVRGESLAFRAYSDPHSLMEEMAVEKLKELLIARCAMPAETADPLAWLENHLVDNAAKLERSFVDELLAAVKVAKTVPETPATPAVTPVVDKIDRKAIEADVLKRVTEIDDLCRSHGIDEKTRKEWIGGDLSVDSIAREILKRKATGNEPLGSTHFSFGESSTDKKMAAAGDALVMRALETAKLDPRKALERAKAAHEYDAIQRSQAIVDRFEKPAAGAADFRYTGMLDLARMFLEGHGQRVFGLPRTEIAQRAFRLSDHLARSGEAMHTTGSFTNVLLDAANKTLLAAYDEADVSYPIWVRRAPSAPDFKTLNRIRFGELPDPEIVPENMPYPDKLTSDAKESYGVEKYGEIFSISLEAVINDDLNAISRIPQMQGNAMRRKINKVVYAILTANDALSDGIALFHATSHGANLDTTALSATALNVGYTVMALQTGLSGTGTVLNIKPKFLICGQTLAPTALIIAASMADPAAGGSAAGGPHTFNLYGPGGPRPLIVVPEGQLDATSTTGWYLAADSSQVDTVEVTFLEGEEAPVLSREEGFAVDAVRYKIRQTFAAKAIDYRGLYQGNT